MSQCPSQSPYVARLCDLLDQVKVQSRCVVLDGMHVEGKPGFSGCIEDGAHCLGLGGRRPERLPEVVVLRRIDGLANGDKVVTVASLKRPCVADRGDRRFNLRETGRIDPSARKTRTGNSPARASLSKGS